MVGAGGAPVIGAEQRLKVLGIELPAPPTPFGAYVEAAQSGRLLFFSGMIPVVNHKPKYVGRIGKELDEESGRDALRIASLGALAAARAHLGTLDKITRVVRLGIYMVTSGDSVDQPHVADAAARLVIGVASLPLGVPVELEVILEVAE